MDLYQQQASNKRWTWTIVFLFILLLGVLGFGFDAFILGVKFPSVDLARRGLSFPDSSAPLSYGETTGLYGSSSRRPPTFPVGTAAALAAGCLMAWIGYRSGPSMVLSSCHARPAVCEAPQEKVLLDVVAEMATAAGLPTPRVYIVPDPEPNAFATGTSPSTAVVAATEGLFKIVNREELQGVIAHEMSHVRNYDVRLMTILAALAGAVALLSDWTGRSFGFGGARGRSGSRDGEGGGAVLIVFFMVWIFLMILAPILSQILALAVSRKREYLADASGAELTRNPLALASALDKIARSAQPAAAIVHGLAHLCIADPKDSAVGDKEGFLPDLLATHPPIRKRIEALKRMALA